MKRMVVSLVFSALVVVVGIGILFGVGGIRSAESTADLLADKPVPKVVVQVLQTQDVKDTRILTGRIAEWEGVTLSAEREGTIELQAVDEGDVVAEGAELVRISARKAAARRDQAKADFLLADQELNRNRGLSDQGISSSRELDQAVAQREAAQAALRLAEIEMEDSVVSSTIAGIVDIHFQEAGEYVNTGTPLVRVVQVDRVKLMLGIPERDVPMFAIGDPVLTYVDAYPDRTFMGGIHRIATSADPSTLTFITEVEIPNADGALRPGMMAKSILVRAEYPAAIAIPLFAVIKEGDSHHVFLENGGTAERRDVRVGFFEGEYIHVLEGLAAGDRLIVVGQRQLESGEPVEVRETIEQQKFQPKNPFVTQ